jgi:hypothetical protein
MTSKTVILLSSLVLLFSTGTAFCAPTYNAATGHWYDTVLSGANGSWNNAESNAIALGGNLVTINDAAEEAWLRSTFSGTTRYWIGFTDSETEGTWKWSSGENSTYVNWNPGEPNNSRSRDSNEDYAVLNWNTSTGAWNDWSYARRDYECNIEGIAEYSAPSTVPVPGSLLLACSGLALVRRVSRGRSLSRKV